MRWKKGKVLLHTRQYPNPILLTDSMNKVIRELVSVGFKRLSRCIWENNNYRIWMRHQEGCVSITVIGFSMRAYTKWKKEGRAFIGFKQCNAKNLYGKPYPEWKEWLKHREGARTPINNLMN